MVSPNEMQQAAKDIMLKGREPSTYDDWVKVVNFWAANITSGMEVLCCALLAKLYDAPLAPEIIRSIAEHQAKVKKEQGTKKDG